MFRAPKVAFDPSPYETRQVFYTSKDGTRVPMFITAKKGLQLDGTNPTLLYAYGGFNISMTPTFSSANAAWLDMGGIYALANLRGGGEYGKDWHEGGMLAKKQNVFDDFIAAAEYLIREKYTSTPKLAIRGGSNGGLLVGAVMTQRPELFGATLPEVGVMDMLRFQKFTIGWAWTSDYGSSDDAGAVQVPARVFSAPEHQAGHLLSADAGVHRRSRRPRRAGSHLQVHRDASGSSGLRQSNSRSDRDEGRARCAGKPTTKQIDEAADRFAFLVRELHMKPALQ